MVARGDLATVSLNKALKRIESAQELRSSSLDLSRLALSELPEEACDLPYLNELNLRGNRLMALPDTIGTLQSLTTLDLRNNWLESLPEELGELVNLTALNLSHNHLAELPEAIGKLPNLTKLDLTGNKLVALPEEICALKNLAELHLRGNKLHTPPMWVAKMGLDVIAEWFMHQKEDRLAAFSYADDTTEMDTALVPLDPLNSATKRSKERKRIAIEVMAFAELAVDELDDLILRLGRFGDNGGPPIDDDDITQELECLKLQRDLLDELISQIEKEKNFSYRFVSSCTRIAKSIDRSFGDKTSSRLAAAGRHLLPGIVKFIANSLRGLDAEFDDSEE